MRCHFKVITLYEINSGNIPVTFNIRAFCQFPFAKKNEEVIFFVKDITFLLKTLVVKLQCDKTALFKRPFYNY